MIGAEQFAKHEADELRRERRPRRPHRRGGALHRAHRRARSPAPDSTSSRASRPPRTARRARLLDLPNVIVTPHLGASTDEAQEKAGVSVARSVRLALGGELVPDAVNVAGGVIDPYVRPGIPLVEKLGQIFAALAHSPLTSLDVEVHGELSAYDVSVLKLAALKGLFTNIVSETVSYVNAPLLAEQRGVEVRLLVDDVSDEYRNVITLRGALSDGSQLSVSGTLTGTKQIEKLVGINDYAIELPIEKHHIVMVYTDRPGIVAVYGQKFGEARHQHRRHADRAPRRPAGRRSRC